MRILSSAFMLAFSVQGIQISDSPAGCPPPDGGNMEVIDPYKVIPRAKPAERDKYVRYVEAHNEIETGKDLVKKGKFAEALEHFEMAISKSKDGKGNNQAAHIHHASCLDALGHGTKAVFEYNNVLRRDPHCAEAYKAKVQVLETMKKFDNAAQTCGDWAKNRRYDPEPLFRRTSLLMKAGKKKEAAQSAQAAYAFCLRHRLNTKEISDLMKTMGITAKETVTSRTAGNSFIYTLAKEMAAIRQPPITGEAKRHKKGQIEKLHDRLTKQDSIAIADVGFAQNGSCEPGHEEILVCLNQAACRITIDDIHQLFPLAKQTEEREYDAFPWLVVKSDLIGIKQAIPNGKIFFFFEPGDPPTLKMLHASWTSSAVPPAIPGWNDCRELAKKELQEKQYSKAAKLVTENWFTAPNYLSNEGLYDTFAEKKALLIAAYAGMGKVGIVKYLNAAPYTHIGYDCEHLNYYQDLPTIDEYDEHQWMASGALSVDDGPRQILCRPYLPISVTSASAETRAKVSSIVGPIAPRKEKKIERVPAEVLNEIDRETRKQK